ncbi:MarR family winged helix-turn-helix transcriptional regulator [Yimella sp. cx-51]|uniref:MarR family winged helix-turn-helix transcriptional regulator n=1 Tax=Yimella sp. cx-51 TaxID=2770551 RepID=UPI00165D5CC0|nr:MarR family transcriptional regulator [Yimella sp. cx-51]MBC9956237.1 MarR family transcriptional regulator [Yimella sp. cx-51]MBD2759683.1 MarR family transcriptional regulator [Yimella sp. cx-573]QTH38617.1 MarR family transcriptional regulator [Yimella sp. cx-51]
MTPDERRTMAEQLRMVCMRISRRTRFENVEDVAPHQFSVLRWLREEPSTIGALADAECVSRPSMTRTIDGLAADGLVQRRADQDDRRRVWVELTSSGRDAVDRTRASRAAWMNERISALTEQECDVLAEATRILDKVVAR